MRESDKLLAGKIEFWEAEFNSDCLVELNLFRKTEWEMFCTRNDSCCLKEENRGIVCNLH
jgi:hypothetical protein